MRCLLMAFVAAIALAGCSSPDPLTNQLLTSSIAPGTGRKSVGVISAIGDKFSVQKVGLTVFQNSLDEVSIDAWGIDERVVATLNAQLGARFDVKRISHSKAAFIEVQKPKLFFVGNQEDYRYKIADILRGIAASQKCDLYVVRDQERQPGRQQQPERRRDRHPLRRGRRLLLLGPSAHALRCQSLRWADVRGPWASTRAPRRNRASWRSSVDPIARSTSRGGQSSHNPSHAMQGSRTPRWRCSTRVSTTTVGELLLKQ